MIIVILLVLAGPGALMSGFVFLFLSVLFALYFGFSESFRTTVEWIFSIQAGLFIVWNLALWYIKSANEQAKRRSAARIQEMQAADAARHAAIMKDPFNPKTLEEIETRRAEIRARLARLKEKQSGGPKQS